MKMLKDICFSFADMLNSINGEKYKMKVKVEVQTVFSFAADIVEFVKTDINPNSFQNCLANIELLRSVGNLLDCVNSRHPIVK